MLSSFWKILLIDDDEDDHIITQEMLSCAREGKYSLDWAETYELGWQKLKADRYDCVLVDYNIGSKNGLDFIRQAVAYQYKAPLILYTGQGDHEMKAEALAAGATLCLSKAETTSLVLGRLIPYAIECKKSVEDGINLIDLLLRWRELRNASGESDH